MEFFFPHGVRAHAMSLSTASPGGGARIQYAWLLLLPARILHCAYFPRRNLDWVSGGGHYPPDAARQPGPGHPRVATVYQFLRRPPHGIFCVVGITLHRCGRRMETDLYYEMFKAGASSACSSGLHVCWQIMDLCRTKGAPHLELVTSTDDFMCQHLAPFIQSWVYCSRCGQLPPSYHLWWHQVLLARGRSVRC